MRNLMLTAFLLTGVLAATPPLATAFGPGPDMSMPMQMQAYQLLFTDEQNAQAESLLKTSKAEHAALIEAAMAEHRALGDLLRNPGATDAQIKAQVMKEAEAKAALLQKDAATNRALRKIATPAQLARIDAQEAKHAARQAKMHAAMEKARKEAKLAD